MGWGVMLVCVQRVNGLMGVQSVKVDGCTEALNDGSTDG